MEKSKVGFNPEQREQLEESRKRVLEITQQRDETTIIQLPLWRDEKRGSPNSFLRSALFAAIQSKDRVFNELPSARFAEAEVSDASAP